MDRSEAARLLNVSEATLARWIRQGLLRTPGAEEGVFERAALEAWARERGLALGRTSSAAPAPPDDLLAAALQRGALTRGARAQDAAGAIEVAVHALPDFTDAQRLEILASTLERERMASTGLGRGVALPHPRTPPSHLLREPRVSVVLLEEPIDWAALDGEPVHSVFLLLSPSAQAHLEILGRAAFALRKAEFTSFLRAKPSKEQLVARLRSMRRTDG